MPEAGTLPHPPALAFALERRARLRELQVCAVLRVWRSGLFGLSSARRPNVAQAECARISPAQYFWRKLTMFRALTALTLLLATTFALTATAPHTQAFEAWCFDDPLIAVNGRLMDVQMRMPVAYAQTARSTALTIIVPKNVTGIVVLDDVSAFPMHTTISATAPAWSGTGAIPVVIQAYVSSATTFPTSVVATPLLAPGQIIGPSVSASGTTNSLITLKTSR